MKNICTLLLMSASGTVMYLLTMLFRRRTKYYLWQYAMLITSIAMLLVPIHKITELPRLFCVAVPESISAGGGYGAELTSRFSAADIIAFIWFLGVVLFTARIAVRYIKTVKTLKQITEECFNGDTLTAFFKVCSALNVKRSVELRTSKYLHSPLLFGIIKPTIIIPEKEFTQRELEMILTHELVHYKHRDLWISLAASIAQCVHWFNPAVHFMARSAAEICEFFCDETVIKKLDPADKRTYGSLILSVIEKELNLNLAYTTSMASAKDSIQKRLLKIVNFKMPTKASTVTGIMIALACGVSALTAFGFETVSEAIPEEIKHIAPIAIPTAKPSEEIPSVTIPEAAYESESSAPLTEIPYESKNNSDNDSYSETAVSDADFDDSEKADETAATDVFSAENEPVTSYVFNADFGDTTELQSDVFSAENGTKLSISKVNGSKDVKVSIHNAETGETIYDEREDRTHDSLSMSLPEGGEYYVKAYSESGDSSGIYIYGE